MLGAAIPLLVLAAAFIVISCNAKLRDAEPVATNKRTGADQRTSAYLLCALAALA